MAYVQLKNHMYIICLHLYINENRRVIKYVLTSLLINLDDCEKKKKQKKTNNEFSNLYFIS